MDINTGGHTSPSDAISFPTDECNEDKSLNKPDKADNLTYKENHSYSQVEQGLWHPNNGQSKFKLNSKLNIDEFRKLQALQNGSIYEYDAGKEIKLLVLVNNESVSYVEVKLGLKISYLLSLFKDRNVLFARNGILINPARTFGNFGFKSYDKIDILPFCPIKQIMTVNKNEWSRINNLNDETRIRIIFQDKVSTEMARINDIRTKRIKNPFLTAPKIIGGRNYIRYSKNPMNRTNMQNMAKYKTTIPDRLEEPSTEPIPYLFPDPN